MPVPSPLSVQRVAPSQVGATPSKEDSSGLTSSRRVVPEEATSPPSDSGLCYVPYLITAALTQLPLPMIPLTQA